MKSLIVETKKSKKFDPIIAVTGMHLQKIHGYTYNEIKKDFKNIKIFKFVNHSYKDSMDIILSKTIILFNKVLRLINPDLVVIHGDRSETLAASINCNLNNILIAHIEGGEVSGTVDESIRHATTKLSHIHFVSNNKAKNILIKMGEVKKNIYIIGSPEVDIMIKKNLPSFQDLMSRYNFKFNKYSIFLFHPVTTLEKKIVINQCKILFNVLKKTSNNFVIIYPNNDTFSDIIFKYINKLKKSTRFKILPSLRFEYYLTLLKNSEFIIGNSSSGIREAPIYGIHTINLGNRQKNRTGNKFIINLKFNESAILKKIKNIKNYKSKKIFSFGRGDSAKKFIKTLNNKNFWKTDKQKYFSQI